MSCRETGAGSSVTSFAKLINRGNITEQATLSTFHYLRNLYLSRAEADRRVYTEQDYREFLVRQRQRVTGNATLTTGERTSLLARLDRADREATPDQATIYALRNLVPTIRDRVAGTSNFVNAVADRMGGDRAATLTRFRTLSRGVTQRDVRGYDDSVTARAAALGLPRDPGTLRAMVQLESEARHFEAAAAARAPQRLPADSRVVVTSEYARLTGCEAGEVMEWGYDPRNGRLEVLMRPNPVGEPRIFAYHNVPSSVVADMHDDAGSAWYRFLRGATEYQYEDEDAATLDGAAPRCASCGQYADSSHACPPVVETTRLSRYGRDRAGRWTRQRMPYFTVDNNNQPVPTMVDVYLPPIARMQQGVRNGRILEVEFNNEYFYLPNPDNLYRRNQGSIGGTASVTRATSRSEAIVDTSNMQCSCAEYRENGHCPHIDVAGQAIRDRIERPGPAIVTARTNELREAAVREASERIERVAAEARAADWMSNPDAATEAARGWRRESEVLYSEDEAAFLEDINEAILARAAKNGDADIPYMTENALGGWCTRESGVGFGMEIEYEFPSSMAWSDKGEANARIARELQAAGLTYSDTVQGYRAAGSRGYRDTHADALGVGNWSLEHDGSVDGELVTPIMYDEPETWEKLRQATEILRRNGAVAGTRAGAHVHVSSKNISSVEKMTAFARLITQHEDDLVRLGTDPQRGVHRNNGFSRPLGRVPNQGFSDITAVHGWQSNSGGRYTTVNFNNCNLRSSDHVEFRVFDSTLEPGAMQAQIKLAVAMTENAARQELITGESLRGKEGWGVHVKRSSAYDPGDRPSDPAVVAEDSATFRSLMDTLFVRREDKKQMVAVFANTSWSPTPN